MLPYYIYVYSGKFLEAMQALFAAFHLGNLTNLCDTNRCSSVHALVIHGMESWYWSEHGINTLLISRSVPGLVFLSIKVTDKIGRVT